MVCMMIIPAALKTVAEQSAKQFDPDGIDDTFSLTLRPIGSSGGATHYYGGPNLIDPPVINAIRSMVSSSQFDGSHYREVPPDHIRTEAEQFFADCGLERVPE